MKTALLTALLLITSSAATAKAEVICSGQKPFSFVDPAKYAASSEYKDITCQAPDFINRLVMDVEGRRLSYCYEKSLLLGNQPLKVDLLIQVTKAGIKVLAVPNRPTTTGRSQASVLTDCVVATLEKMKMPKNSRLEGEPWIMQGSIPFRLE